MNLQSKGIIAQVEQTGQGEQLLLLHGWGPASVSMAGHLRPLAARLQHRYEVTMVDFPGHGGSGQPGVDWGVKEYAEWTLGLMDQLGLARPTLIAHSFGGRVALWLAAHHPQRVQALVLTGCAGLRPRATLRGRLRAWMFKAARGALAVLGMFPALKARQAGWLASLRGQFASADYLDTPEALRGSFSRVVREDLRPLLPRVTQPVLLVWGEQDQATPLWMGQVMAKELPDARLLVYQDEDHFAYLNQLARFTNAVDIFLEEERA